MQTTIDTLLVAMVKVLIDSRTSIRAGFTSLGGCGSCSVLSPPSVGVSQPPLLPPFGSALFCQHLLSAPSSVNTLFCQHLLPVPSVSTFCQHLLLVPSVSAFCQHPLLSTPSSVNPFSQCLLSAPSVSTFFCLHPLLSAPSVSAFCHHLLSPLSVTAVYQHLLSPPSVSSVCASLIRLKGRPLNGLGSDLPNNVVYT